MTKREIVICAVAAVIVVGVVCFNAGLRPASAQGMVSESGNTILVVGSEKSSRWPLFLVDTREQTLMIYKYGMNSNSLELSVARSYQWDKRLESYGNIKGASPGRIKKEVTRR